MVLFLQPRAGSLVVHLICLTRCLRERVDDNLQVRLFPGLVLEVLHCIAEFLHSNLPRFMHPSAGSGCTFTFVETLPDSAAHWALDPANLGALPREAFAAFSKGRGTRVGYMIIGNVPGARYLAVILALLRSGCFTGRV